MTGRPDGSAYPLPLQVEDITAAWLTSALHSRYPDVTVTGVDRLEVLEGTATKVLVGLTVTGPPSEAPPDRLWVKGGFAEHREYVGALGVYAGEVDFFTDVAPHYDLRCPESYFALKQDDPVQGIVALEDLRARGVEFSRATRPLSVEHTAAGLDTLAQLHGQTRRDGLAHGAGLQVVMGPHTDAIWQDWLAALPEYFAAPRAYAAPTALRDPDRLRAATAAYRSLVGSEPDCLLHGDSHVGNTYVEPDGSVGFVDWQVIARGRWFHDVNYFVVSALDFPDRQAYERELLEHYRKAMSTYDVAVPSAADAWEQYRQATVYGYLAWLCNPDIWQPADVNAATFARFAMAMHDHDTYALLGV